jgi:hypothetical protein
VLAAWTVDGQKFGWFGVYLYANRPPFSGVKEQKTFDHFICSRQHSRWNRQAELLGLEIDDESNFVGYWVRANRVLNNVIEFLNLVGISISPYQVAYS